MESFFAKQHLAALLVTMLSESSGVLLFSIGTPSQKDRLVRNFLAAILINLIMHTIFWYTFPLFDAGYLTNLYLYELIIVAVEGTFYSIFMRIKIYTALILSFVLNLISFYAGPLFW